MDKEEIQRIIKEAEEVCYGDPKLALLAAILNELEMLNSFVFDGFGLGNDFDKAEVV